MFNGLRQSIQHFSREDTHDGKSHGRCRSRVAVLVDCDNTSPEILEYALRVVAQFGRVVLRGAMATTVRWPTKWQEALVRLAFTPCLQYQYAAGKNVRPCFGAGCHGSAVRRPRDDVLHRHQRL